MLSKMVSEILGAGAELRNDEIRYAFFAADKRDMTYLCLWLYCSKMCFNSVDMLYGNLYK